MSRSHILKACLWLVTRIPPLCLDGGCSYSAQILGRLIRNKDMTLESKLDILKICFIARKAYFSFIFDRVYLYLAHRLLIVCKTCLQLESQASLLFFDEGVHI